MKKHSCGAILYAIYNNTVYVVLGMEKGNWFPFKGTRERGETNVQAAIREIKEETCGALHVDHIKLSCNYSTKRKHYHIGLTRISVDEFSQFYHNRSDMLNERSNRNTSSEYNWSYMEKDDIKMFPIDYIMCNKFHEITTIPIRYYHKHLAQIQRDVRTRVINTKAKLIPKINSFTRKNQLSGSLNTKQMNCIPMTLV
jgi:hypothetical protein